MGELARILGDDKLARPTHDPCWDAWHAEFSSTDRKRLAPFMGGSVTPDVLASWLYVSVDDALWKWREACLAELKSLRHDPLADDYHQAAQAELDEADARLVGPSELAEYWGVTNNCIRVWKHRGKLPTPHLVISGTPIWRWGDVVSHVEDMISSGRFRDDRQKGSKEHGTT